MTQKYLNKKKQMNEQARKAKKDIDRRASKNRKIRYVVHEKILNFLTPLHNTLAVEGREALVNNLFGVKKILQAGAADLAGKKRKSGKAAKGEVFEEDPVALI